MDNLKFLDHLVSSFEKLPGVGKKTATRYAFAIVEKYSEEEVQEFAQALINTKQDVKHCQVCQVLTHQDTCDICQDQLRNHSQILVVKDTKDLLSIEKSKQYNGTYHVLGGLISPLEGIGPDEINITVLEERTKNKEVTEVILATSFTPAGETTALYLEKILKREGLVISRIGYGLPAGGDIEYADELTLKKALEARSKR